MDAIDEGGLFIFLDLEKAFDRCSWSYLHKALRALRFTSEFTTWTDILYDTTHPPKRKVYANGFLSGSYDIKVGTAQGCPLSPLLFLVIIEGFTRMCLKDKKLQGLEIGDLLFKILHFADDTMFCPEGSDSNSQSRETHPHLLPSNQYAGERRQARSPPRWGLP